jgi:hypothetical protein
VDGSVLIGGALVGGGALATMAWFVSLRRGGSGHREVGDGSPGQARVLTEAARNDLHTSDGAVGDVTP